MSELKPIENANAQPQTWKAIGGIAASLVRQAQDKRQGEK